MVRSKVMDLGVGERAATVPWAAWRDTAGRLWIDGEYPLLGEGSDPACPPLLVLRLPQGFALKGHFDYGVPPWDLRRADVVFPVVEWERLVGPALPPYRPTALRPHVGH